MISALKLRRISLSLLLLAIALLLSGRAQAQRGSEFAQAAASLPPDARAVIDRLSSLSQLPSATWKMHAGDVAHGEEVNLDDSAWGTNQGGLQSAQ